MDVNSNDLVCNGGINPYHQPVSSKIMTVPAGAQVTAEWHHTLDGLTPSDAADPIDGSHKGPVLAYLYGSSYAYIVWIVGLMNTQSQRQGWERNTEFRYWPQVVQDLP